MIKKPATDWERAAKPGGVIPAPTLVFSRRRAMDSRRASRPPRASATWARTPRERTTRRCLELAHAAAPRRPMPQHLVEPCGSDRHSGHHATIRQPGMRASSLHAARARFRIGGIMPRLTIALCVAAALVLRGCVDATGRVDHGRGTGVVDEGRLCRRRRKGPMPSTRSIGKVRGASPATRKTSASRKPRAGTTSPEPRPQSRTRTRRRPGKSHASRRLVRPTT